MHKSPDIPSREPFLTPGGALIGKPDPGPFSRLPGPVVKVIGMANPNGARLPAQGTSKKGSKK